MSIVGTWNTTMNTPMGAQQATLTLNEDGTGKMAGAQGDMEVTDGNIDGDAAQWKAAITAPMAMTLEFDAKAEGDNITGSVKLGAFGNATFEGTRV